jgi:hypothetical protein
MPGNLLLADCRINCVFRIIGITFSSYTHTRSPSPIKLFGKHQRVKSTTNKTMTPPSTNHPSLMQGHQQHNCSNSHIAACHNFGMGAPQVASSPSPLNKLENYSKGVIKDGVYLPLGLELDVNYCLDILSTQLTLQQISLNPIDSTANIDSNNTSKEDSKSSNRTVPVKTRPIVNNKKRNMVSTVEYFSRYSSSDNTEPVKKKRKLYRCYW